MYQVDTTRVARQTRTFTADVLQYWAICVAEIAANPFARLGTYIHRVAPIRGLPMRTYLYEITTEVSISGEVRHIFTAEFFPWYIPVYVINEDANEVAIIYLRENHLV